MLRRRTSGKRYMKINNKIFQENINSGSHFFSKSLLNQPMLSPWHIKREVNLKVNNHLWFMQVRRLGQANYNTFLLQFWLEYLNSVPTHHFSYSLWVLVTFWSFHIIHSYPNRSSLNLFHGKVLFFMYMIDFIKLSDCCR